jgi:ligand-binding sensor domain-containing protein
LTTVFFTFQLLVALSPIGLFGQKISLGIPMTEYFSPEDYNGGILNYCIAQDQRGYILVGNNKGILEYDGTRWRKYSIDGNSRTRAIYPDESGKIFVGTQNQLGYLWPDNKGKYMFHSLNHLIPKEEIDFDDIWHIFKTSEGIVFSNVTGLFTYDGQSISYIPFEQLTIQLHYYNNKIYNNVIGVGLLVLDGSAWVLANQGGFFFDKEVQGINTYNEKYDLISTFEHGLFLVGQHDVIPWAEPYLSTFSQHKILLNERLKDGTYAIGTDTDGLYLLNENGTLIYHFTKGTGLKSRTVLDIFEDSFGNLWVGQNNGISKIEWNSPFRFLNEEIDLPGTGYTSYATDKYIYLGTNNGLYYYDREEILSNAAIKKIDGIEGQVYNIQEVNGDILVACHIGAYQLDGEKAIEISNGTGWWTFITTTNPNLAIAGGYSGIFLVKKIDGLWTIEKHFIGFTESSRIMQFDDDDVLWMSHGYKGVYAFHFTPNYDSLLEVNFYNKKNGFPENFGINAFKVAGELIFSTSQGIFGYNKKTDSFAEHQKFSEFIDSTMNIKYMIEDNLGDIFFISEKFSGIMKKNNWDYTLDKSSLNKIHPLFNDDLERISNLAKNGILFAAREGFIHFNKSHSSKHSREFDVAIRHIDLTKTDSILFDGNFISEGVVIKEQSDDNIPELIYDNNSLYFSYSALEFDDIKPLYRYKLQGYEDKWSIWTNTTEKEYTNLHEGKYTFDVEAKNATGIHSPIVSYQFEILAPWYRKSWVIIFGLISTLSLSFWMVYFNRKNKKIITKQEKALMTQDLQLKEVSEKSKEQINLLKNEKLEDEIRHKKTQLATTTMNLIDKNEFINHIQKNIDDLMQEKSEQKSKQRLRKIFNDIEKNKTEDKGWGQFELHFNEVNDGFTKKLRSQFETLSPQEIRLSIYLRMNLSTKEIANLSHVTTRAVEMSRYRLRKKLSLDKETNLIDFLMKM